MAATADTGAFRPDGSVTVKFTGTASTYPLPACSQASRSLELRPYTSSPAIQANGIPASAAPVIICVPRVGLVVNAASSGTCALSRLAVLHLPGDPGMLPGHAGRGGPLLQLGGLV